MINLFKKISILTWILWGLVSLSIALVYYADYENEKWGTDIGAIQEKYFLEWAPFRKAIPRGEITVSGEVIYFFAITQGEIDSIKTSYNSGFYVGLGQSFSPVETENLHKNSYKNDVISIGPRVCYSLVYNNYPSIINHNLTTKKSLLEPRDAIQEINQYCKNQGIYEDTLRPEVIKNLQDLRNIFEKNGIEVMNYMNSLPSWKEKLLDVVNYHFFRKSEISKVIIGGVLLTIIIETITKLIIFMRRKKL